jgi:anti-sigma28 factor (negative regulator of flagellin synthesis)
MSNTTRHTPQRRPPVSASRKTPLVAQPLSANSPNRVDTLRRLVAAGQYHVSPKYLASKIFRAAGLD